MFWAPVVAYAALLLVSISLSVRSRRVFGVDPIRVLANPVTSAESGAALLIAVGMLLGFAGSLLGAADVFGHLWDVSILRIAGGGLAVAAVALCTWAQLTMGASWRVGVDPTERTDLITGGPFRLVRNPIFAAMAAIAAAGALIAPNPLTLAAFVIVIVGIEIQVRVVEEPYLRATHGSDYVAYLQSAGRLLPFVGREAA